MLQRVAARKAEGRLDRAVEGLEEEGGGVAGEKAVHPGAPSLSAPEEEGRDEDDEDGGGLEEGVGAQVAEEPPGEDGDKADGDEWKDEAPACLRIHAVGDDGGRDRREGDRHRKAVPEEGSVVGSPVVVGRAETRGGDGGKEENPGPSFPGLGKRGAVTPGQDDGQPPEADGYKGDVRKDVRRVRNRTEARRVGEAVVVLRLLLRHQREDGDEKSRHGRAERKEDATAAGHAHGGDANGDAILRSLMIGPAGLPGQDGR